ncbi:hypothetical protein CSUI_002257 [Cystoisospora suis]|uniref:Transmembrane protein n=1 Tax=Cystoisospora suis TaxID=483139 RepID=A0A2C6L765_9APIC|nr:hypothetical protein CSUI_002257 [Cystoisospora suis]
MKRQQVLKYIISRETGKTTVFFSLLVSRGTYRLLSLFSKALCLVENLFLLFLPLLLLLFLLRHSHLLSLPLEVDVGQQILCHARLLLLLYLFLLFRSPPFSSLQVHSHLPSLPLLFLHHNAPLYVQRHLLIQLKISFRLLLLLHLRLLLLFHLEVPFLPLCRHLAIGQSLRQSLSYRSSLLLLLLLFKSFFQMTKKMKFISRNSIEREDKKKKKRKEALSIHRDTKHPLPPHLLLLLLLLLI